MNAPLHPKVIHAGQQRNELSARLACEVQGEILFSRGDRGRYATDASIYQADPIGVLVPKTFDDVRTAPSICPELRAPDRKSTRLNSSHQCAYRLPSSA